MEQITDSAHSTAYTVGGVKISCVDTSEAIDNFFELARSGAGGFITVTSSHGIVEAQADKTLRSIINSARMTLADGMPVFWIGRLKGAKVRRVCGSDFFSGVMQDPRSRDLRHYFYGGLPRVHAAISKPSQREARRRSFSGFTLSPVSQARSPRSQFGCNKNPGRKTGCDLGRSKHSKARILDGKPYNFLSKFDPGRSRCRVRLLRRHPTESSKPFSKDRF